jgi:hypothetical protein
MILRLGLGNCNINEKCNSIENIVPNNCVVCLSVLFPCTYPPARTVFSAAADDKPGYFLHGLNCKDFFNLNKTLYDYEHIKSLVICSFEQTVNDYIVKGIKLLFKRPS